MKHVAPSAVLVSCLLASATVLGAPDEELLGKSRGYPIGTRGNWFLDESVRVGSFSNLDKITPHNVLPRSSLPLELKNAVAPPDLHYTFKRQRYSIDDYLEHQRASG